MKNKNSVVTIGTFDGVHKGHNALLKRLKTVGDKHNLKTRVIVLETPFKNVSGLLTETSEKLNLLSQSGVNEIFVIPKSSEIFKESAEIFLKDFLVKRLKTRHIVAGHDFAFGKNKTGTYRWLKGIAPALKLRVDLVKAVKVKNETVSSSKIRETLKSGNLKKAASMLGRNYSFEGKSAAGRGVGTKIGFPTINIKTHTGKMLPSGVFAAAVKIKNALYPAVLNIGSRPTFNLGSEIVPEAHLLTPTGKIKHGTKIETELLKKIRPEKKFASPEALMKAINADIKAAKRHFCL